MAFNDIPIRQNGKGFQIVASWFNTIRTELINAFGAGGYIAVEDPSVVSNGGEFIFSLISFKPLLRVSGDGGAVIASSTPFGNSHGFSNGKEIVLLGLDNTNTVTLEINDIAGGFISGKGKLVLSKFKQVIVIYNADLDRFILQE